MRIIIAILILIFITLTSLYADTVVTKDGKKIKGLVVEEYTDRIKLSTVDGERDISREDIERVEYDTPEQNFMQLGRAYDAKGWHDKAVVYYKKAMELNPDYKEAKDAYLSSHAEMWRQEEKMTIKEVERQHMVMDWWKERRKETSSLSKDKALLLRDVIGISLVQKEGVFTIDEVRPYSAAARAGIQKGDNLVGIWGRRISYSKMERIIDELLGPKYSEVRVLVEREISIGIDERSKNLYKELGILLGFEYEGLVIKDIVDGKRGAPAGFKKGDFVVAINKNITRYLPLDNIIALINSADDKNIIFTVERTINLRREGK